MSLLLSCRRQNARWRRLTSLAVALATVVVVFLYVTIRDAADIAVATGRASRSRTEKLRYRSRDELLSQRSGGKDEDSRRVIADWQRAAEQIYQQQQQQQKQVNDDVIKSRRRTSHMKRDGMTSSNDAIRAVLKQVNGAIIVGDRKLNGEKDASSKSRRAEVQQFVSSAAGPTAIAASDDSKQPANAAPVAALRGGPGKCRVYDVRRPLDPTTTDFSDDDCVQLKLDNVFPHRSPGNESLPLTFNSSSAVGLPSSSSTVTICPHPDNEDEHLSKPLRLYGIWEPHIVRQVMGAASWVVSNSPATARIGIYDLGANVGQYSVLAAGVLGVRVVAVEPFRPNVLRLHQAVMVNRIQNRVIVVENALSDVRDTFELSVVIGNPSGVSLTSQDADRYCDDPECPAKATTIYMDDLLEVTNFDVAVMKIDIEGHEHRAFVNCEELLSNVKVEYIFMEWTKMKDYYGAEADDNENKRLVQAMVNKLTLKFRYTPYGVNEGQLLDPRYHYGWPHDVVWVREGAPSPNKLLQIVGV